MAVLKAKRKNKDRSGSNEEHALLSPSSAKKWLGCPAALTAEIGIPNPSNPAAEAGTAMHAVAEIMANNLIRDGESKAASEFVGGYPLHTPTKKSKGPKFTDEMAKMVQGYIDTCVAPLVDAGAEVYIESRVDLSRPLGAPNTFGTADLVAVTELTDGSNMLIVGDLKTGRHPVDAKENRQMMIYALGLLNKYRFSHDITKVRLMIYQPFCGGVSEWDTSAEVIETFGKFAKDRAAKALACHAAGKAALKPGDFRPSADACQWCRFREKCNAARKFNEQIAADDLRDESGDEMTPEELAEAYAKLPALRQHIKNIESATYKALLAGTKLPGLKLVAGKDGNRTWSDEALVQLRLEQGGVTPDAMYTQKLLTPTQAEKALPAGAFEWVEELITRKPGEPSIASADDKRPEYVPVNDDDLVD
uniref:Gp43 n=1 Tax=Edwardsiella phage eiMSLS TaxID=945085 RepID=E7EL44_9VIRU|nr:gp43 [Edwardsiella phage eiMSLS]